MATLENWSPSRQLDRFRRDLDELMERLTGDFPWSKRQQPVISVPPIESFVEGDKLTIRVDLPGIDPKDVELTVVGDMLTIRGSREEKHETKKPHFIRRELSYGSFERSIELPEGIKAEDLKASHRDGVLEVTATVPRELSQKEVKIQIESGKAKNGEVKERKAS
jgi:HSP20 family protein